jgi:hypothetical protein
LKLGSFGKMTETKPEEPKPVPVQDAVEKDSPQEVDEASDKFETVGAKSHHVEKIKKNYSKPVGHVLFHIFLTVW